MTHQTEDIVLTLRQGKTEIARVIPARLLNKAVDKHQLVNYEAIVAFEALAQAKATENKHE